MNCGTPSEEERSRVQTLGTDIVYFVTVGAQWGASPPPAAVAHITYDWDKRKLFDLSIGPFETRNIKHLFRSGKYLLIQTDATGFAAGDPQLDSYSGAPEGMLIRADSSGPVSSGLGSGASISNDGRVVIFGLTVNAGEIGSPLVGFTINQSTGTLTRLSSVLETSVQPFNCRSTAISPEYAFALCYPNEIRMYDLHNLVLGDFTELKRVTMSGTASFIRATDRLLITWVDSSEGNEITVYSFNPQSLHISTLSYSPIRVPVSSINDAAFRSDQKYLLVIGDRTFTAYQLSTDDGSIFATYVCPETCVTFAESASDTSVFYVLTNNRLMVLKLDEVTRTFSTLAEITLVLDGKFVGTKRGLMVIYHHR